MGSVELLDHRRDAPAIKRQGVGTSTQWTLSRSELTRALSVGPSLVDRLEQAGYLARGHTPFSQIQWMLNASKVSCKGRLPLAQTPAQSLPGPQHLDDSRWASQYFGPWPNRGFPYDEVSTGKILAVGTGTFITGALRIHELIPGPDSTLHLTGHAIARLRPPAAGNVNPAITIDRDEPEHIQAWLSELIGSRYTPRRGGSLALI
ncbi:hypothetical protein [Paenarthrobacter nitroguajacolicus]|uniref:hypothetical protein n=1 Tax=Paenarthrobacter nitroguajacolicus TaxID=211146 RepID=UPI0015BC2DFD|nr:hypothetical protein [Paenarthrobacter nitroguajacolicus]